MKKTGRKNVGAGTPGVFPVNWDGLVGPTHHYAGLSFGNVASAKNRGRVANPRAAALQGLEKMRVMAGKGSPQCLLPPHGRPHLDFLRRLGFSGSPSRLLEAAYRVDPSLVAIAWSASSMWTANAATYSPAWDHEDGVARIVPANLIATPHRSLEAPVYEAWLRRFFPEQAGFRCQHPLPADSRYGDEGAANHIRFSPAGEGSGSPGLHLFVHGRGGTGMGKGGADANRYPARQSLAASQALVRLHALPEEQVYHLRQSPAAVNAGVFHNDVISVGWDDLWWVHEQAYVHGAEEIKRVAAGYKRLYGSSLKVWKVSARRLTLGEAVKTYLFNSQIYTLPDGGKGLVCARECRENSRAWDILREGLDGGWLREVEILDLRQSMRNGGGPACLRWHTDLTPSQWEALPAGLKMDGKKIAALESWVGKYYRDRLSERDLLDPGLMGETRKAFQALESLLALPGLYAPLT